MVLPILRRFREKANAERMAEHRRSFHERRGYIINAWAAFEIAIDLANEGGWNAVGRRFNKELPVNFNRKIELFRKVNLQAEAMKPLNERALAILDRLLPLLDDRHRLVHGFTLPDDDPEGWTVRRTIFLKDKTRTEVTRFTPAHLERIEVEVASLKGQVAEYTRLCALQFGHREDDRVSG